MALGKLKHKAVGKVDTNTHTHGRAFDLGVVGFVSEVYDRELDNEGQELRE